MRSNRPLWPAWVCLAALLAGGCAPAVQHAPQCLRLPAEGVAVPLTLVDETMEVEVHIDGQGPYRFMVDTGFSTAVTLSQELGQALARDRGLTPHPVDMAFRGASGESVHVRQAVALPSLTLGDAEFLRLDALIVDLQAVGIDGVLGFPLFRECLLTLDCEGRTLRLIKGRLPSPNGRDILPLRRGAGLGPAVPRVLVDFGDAQAWTLIDSGFGGALEIPRAAGRRLVLRGPARESRTYRTLGGRDQPLEAVLGVPATLGCYRLDRPYVLLGHEYRLGTEILRHFLVTFDQAGGAVRWTGNGACRP